MFFGIILLSKISRGYLLCVTWLSLLFYFEVLCGLYPIAQLREPYSTIQWLCERLDIVKLFKLESPFEEIPAEEYDWSAYEVCEQYALKKRYKTKRSNPDAYRAANEILRFYTQGRIQDIYLLPPDENLIQQQQEDLEESEEGSSDDSNF